MACVIKRDKNDIITEVRLPDGKTDSVTYRKILDGIQEGIPGEYTMTSMASLNKYVGKFIKNTSDPEEIALGLYLQLYDKKFKQWYGEWQTEPEIDKDLTITNSKGSKVSIFEFGKYHTPIQQKLSSARTKATSRLLKSVDLVVRELKDRIKLAIDAREKSKLNKEYSKDQKIERERYFNGLIKKFNQQIETLTKNNQMEYVIAQGLSDMQIIREVLSGPIVNLTEVKFASNIAEVWSNLNSILEIPSIEEGITDPDLKKRAESIVSESLYNRTRIGDLAKKLIVEAYNNSMPEDRQITIDDLAAFKDVSAWKGLARDITTVDNATIGYLAKIINEANLKISKEHNRNYGLIEQAFDKIKNNPEIQANGFNIFIKEQTTKIGGKTIGLRGRFSQNYYDSIRLQSQRLRENLDKAGDDKEAVKAAYKVYNEWVANNTILFDSAPFINKEGNYTDDDRMKVINSLTSQGFTKDEVADMIREANKQYKRYEEQAEIYKTRLFLDILGGVIEVEEGMNNDEFIDKKVEEWKKINDPIAFIEFTSGRTSAFENLQAFKGGKYSVKFPVKTLEGKNSEYYDENFSKIASDKNLYEFYVFFRDFIKEQLSYLPEEEINDLQSNFLPVIIERMAKEYGFTALKETTKNLGDWFFKHLTIVDYDKNKKISPVTGKERFSFESRFINEDVDTEERSKDLVLMMKLFSDMALIYKHKIQIQDQVDSINDIVQNADSVIVEDKFGERVERGTAPKQLQNMVGSAIKRSYYQIQPEAEGVNYKRRFYNIWELLSFGGYKSEQYLKAKELQDKIQRLDESLKNDTLKEEDRRALEKELRTAKTDYYKLGGRNVSVSGFLDGLNSLTRQKGLGFNPFSAFRNLVIGGLNNVIHATGGEDYNMTDYWKATGIIKASAAKYISWGAANSEDAEKILKFNLDSKIVDESSDEIFKSAIKGINKQSTWESIKKALPSPLGLMKSTDYIFKSQTAVSMLVHTKVQTEKGEFSLYEVMDRNLEYNEEKYGKWLDEKNGGKTFEEIYDDVSSKVGQVAKKLHGFSGGGQSLAGKDSVYLRMLFVFKTWLPETVATRFEAKRYDPILERYTEGYYRTFINRLFGEKGFRFKGVLSDLYNAAIKNETGDLTKEDIANLRKLMTEFGAILTIFLLHMMLAAAFDDDDEKWKKLLVNQMELLNRDMTYYTDPSSIESLTQNVVPSIGTITQGIKAVRAVGGYALNEENNDGEPMYDGEKTLLKITKALPYLNNVNRVVYYSQRIGDVR